ncbi:MAG TPA: hypothetical protein VEV17_02810 [Bryobacteraceae bacterium]|nr:hypothetical protein [Bryobacteraceae bacterium]
MASWYLLSVPEVEAIERVPAGIRRYNEAAGTSNAPDSGYRETLTRFWLAVLAGFLRQDYGRPEKLGVIRRVVDKFGPQRDLYRQYYSFDVVRSRKERAKWVSPASPRISQGTRVHWKTSNVTGPCSRGSDSDILRNCIHCVCSGIEAWLPGGYSLTLVETTESKLGGGECTNHPDFY